MSGSIKRLAELFSDDAFAEEVLADSAEETQVNLAKRGYQFSLDDLKEFAAFFDDSNDCDLKENHLDDVTGGAHLDQIFSYQLIKKHIKKW